MGTITNANRLVQAQNIAAGNVIPGIDNTRHIVVGVKEGRNLVLGRVVRITTAEIFPSGRTSPITHDTDLRASERLWVEN